MKCNVIDITAFVIDYIIYTLALSKSKFDMIGLNLHCY